MSAPYPWLQSAYDKFLAMHGKGLLHHAYLISGQQDIGKGEFAATLAKFILCEHPTNTACGQCKSCHLIQSGAHPDFIQVKPIEAGKAISIEQIRSLIEKCELTPHYGKRVIIIEPMEAVHYTAMQTLLKTLEEPNAHHTFLMVCNELSSIPATINSRCQKIPLNTPSFADFKHFISESVDSKQIESLYQLSSGAPLKALELLEEDTYQVYESISEKLKRIGQQTSVQAELKKEMMGLSTAELIRHWLGFITSCIKNITINSGKVDQQTLQDLFSLQDELYSLKREVVISRIALNKEYMLNHLLMGWQSIVEGKYGRIITGIE